MTAKRLFIVLSALVGALLLAMIIGAYGINSLLAKQSNKLVALKAKSQALSQEQVSLVKANKQIQTYSSLEQITKAVVPQDKDQAEAVREIVNIAGANGVNLGSITFPASTLGSTSTQSGSSTSTPVATPSANSTKNTLSQLTPVKGIPGVYQMPITVQSDSSSAVPYDKFISFLSGLEHNRRTSQVTSITLTPDPKNPLNLTFSLILNDYIKP